MPQLPLKELLDKAHNGKLVLPEFQREFVWKPSDVLKLLSSLLNNYPIGGLLFMENNAGYAYQSLDGAPDVTNSTEANKDLVLILDGQQRITSCYRAFINSITSTKNPGRYYFDFEKYSALNTNERSEIEGSRVEEFLTFKPKKEVEQKIKTSADEMSLGLFPLDIILGYPRGTDYSKWLSDYSFSKSNGEKLEFGRRSNIQAEFIKKFIERITGYQVHYEEIRRDASSEVICTVFETINTTGKRLTVFDLLVARCYAKGLKLREELLSAIEENVYINHFDPEGEEICPIALPKIIALMDNRQCKRSELLTLPAEIIQLQWGKAVAALESALQLLSTQLGAVSLRFIPQKDIIPPLAVITSHKKWIGNEPQVKKLKKWYWRCIFSSYFSGSPDSSTVRTVKEWTDDSVWLDNDTNEPEVVKNFSFFDNILDDVARVDNSIYLGIMSSILSTSPCDFGKDRTLVGSGNQASWNSIEDHHIYPKGLLASHGIKGEEANQISNRTPILQETNQIIKNKAPDYYLKDTSICKIAINNNDLQKHLIDCDIISTPFSKDIYKQFINSRKQLLIGRIVRLVEQDPITSGDE